MAAISFGPYLHRRQPNNAPAAVCICVINTSWVRRFAPTIAGRCTTQRRNEFFLPRKTPSILQKQKLCPLKETSTALLFPIIYNNISGDVARKSDPPGDDNFVYCHVDSHFDTTGSMSTMTDPPPSVSLLNYNHGTGSMSTMTDPPPSVSILNYNRGAFSISQNICALSIINEEDCS